MSPTTPHPFTLLISSRFQPGEPYGAQRSTRLNLQDSAARALQGPDSRALPFGTEGDTDSAWYRQQVGRSSAQVWQDGGAA